MDVSPDVVKGGKRKVRSVSKYDFSKVKVWVEPLCEHHFVLSRFLLSRMLTVTKIPSIKAVKIALGVKKFLVDNDLLDVPQSCLEAILFDSMAQQGFGREYVERYRLVSCFFMMRVPLVVLLSGAPCSMKSTLAQALADVMNMPNVQQTELMYELVKGQHGVSDAPVWEREFERAQAAIDTYRQECVVVRRAMDHDLSRVFRDGKPLIIEGMHVDPGLYLSELGLDVGVSSSPRKSCARTDATAETPSAPRPAAGRDARNAPDADAASHARGQAQPGVHRRVVREPSTEDACTPSGLHSTAESLQQRCSKPSAIPCPGNVSPDAAGAGCSIQRRELPGRGAIKCAMQPSEAGRDPDTERHCCTSADAMCDGTTLVGRDFAGESVERADEVRTTLVTAEAQDAGGCSMRTLVMLRRVQPNGCATHAPQPPVAASSASIASSRQGLHSSEPDRTGCSSSTALGQRHQSAEHQQSAACSASAPGAASSCRGMLIQSEGESPAAPGSHASRTLLTTEAFGAQQLRDTTGRSAGHLVADVNERADASHVISPTGVQSCSDHEARTDPKQPASPALPCSSLRPAFGGGCGRASAGTAASHDMPEQCALTSVAAARYVRDTPTAQTNALDAASPHPTPLQQPSGAPCNATVFAAAGNERSPSRIERIAHAASSGLQRQNGADNADVGLTDAPAPAVDEQQDVANGRPALSSHLARARAIVEQLIADRPVGLRAHTPAYDWSKLSHALPIVIPMVVSVDPLDARGLLLAWHRRRTLQAHEGPHSGPATPSKASSFDRVYHFSRQLDQYLCAYESVGVPVYHVNLGNSSAVLTSMHDHVLGAIQQCMASCLAGGHESTAHSGASVA